MLDADHDGRLDVYATRYVTWTAENDLFCTLDGESKAYCTPESYEGASPRFYRNVSEGGTIKLEDRTKEAGLYKPTAKSLGVTVLDLDGDGWEDMAVANDTQPNLLYRNKGKGVFEEIGVASGMAFSEAGVARGGMGIDAADYDHSGRPSIVIGNFANEMVALYRNEGNQLFVDVAPTSHVGRKTLLNLTFGAFYFDYDLDGWLDLFLANGHLDPDVERIQPRVTYAQPSQLFHNEGKGRYVEVTGDAVAELPRRPGRPRRRLGRLGPGRRPGHRADHQRRQGGRVREPPRRQPWLRLDLHGTRSDRDGLGSRIEVTVGGETQRWLVRAGGSYLSQARSTRCSDWVRPRRRTRSSCAGRRAPSRPSRTWRADQVFEVTEPRRSGRGRAVAAGGYGALLPAVSEPGSRRPAAPLAALGDRGTPPGLDLRPSGPLRRGSAGTAGAPARGARLRPGRASPASPRGTGRRLRSPSARINA